VISQHARQLVRGNEAQPQRSQPHRYARNPSLHLGLDLETYQSGGGALNEPPPTPAVDAQPPTAAPSGPISLTARAGISARKPHPVVTCSESRPTHAPDLAGPSPSIRKIGTSASMYLMANEIL